MGGVDPSGGIEAAKRAAACQAVDDFVADAAPGTIAAIGIGSGSTIVYAVERLAQLARSSRPDLRSCLYVPTSHQSRELIRQTGCLSLGDLTSCPCLDVAFDGADECDSSLNCIKGGGAAHLQEKIVASCADRFVVIADYRKDSPILGREWRSGVPLEVASTAYVPVMHRLDSIGSIRTVLRMGVRKAGPVVTDNGNFVVDADFGEIDDPAALDRRLHDIPGILETGLFVGLVDKAYFGQDDGTVSVRSRTL
ncbi:ribose-5-phosphate isomerase [Plasmodiophora brassicae]|uniref:ribose-5-phosphate isomerase n=1 Tax=Plasmodiophora brassicae TaxID=37360 RepID=A0A0G4IKT2_PLABS|nr:hypothetical protein PBRA_004413 [Plasmodiophora brassicae]SPQ99950.1 unnamed protein product [Plasmodiophora brassicae]